MATVHALVWGALVNMFVTYRVFQIVVSVGLSQRI
jgi:hypothetical protein